MTGTTETKTPFPERMHQTAVDSHTRRAVKALSDLIERAATLRDRLQAAVTDEYDDAGKLSELAGSANYHLGALEVLRETREWDEAENGEQQR